MEDCCRIAIDTFKVRPQCNTLYTHRLEQYYLNPRVKACVADTGGHPRVLEYVLQNIVELSAPSDATLVVAWNKAQSDYGNVPNYSADVICSALLGEPITRTTASGSKTEYAELEEKGAVVLQEIGNVLVCQIPFFMLSKRLTWNPNIDCLKPFLHYFTAPFWAERDLAWETFEKEVAKIEALRLSLLQTRQRDLRGILPHLFAWKILLAISTLESAPLLPKMGVVPLLSTCFRGHFEFSLPLNVSGLFYRTSTLKRKGNLL